MGGGRVAKYTVLSLGWGEDERRGTGALLLPVEKGDTVVAGHDPVNLSQESRRKQESFRLLWYHIGLGDIFK